MARGSIDGVPLGRLSLEVSSLDFSVFDGVWVVVLCLKHPLVLTIRGFSKKLEST